MKRTRLFLVALLLVGAVLTSCGGDDDESGSSSSESSTTAAKAEFNDADVTFVQGMIPHHEEAVEMAGLAETRAESAAVKDLAARIEEAQGPEIEKMQGWLEVWGKSASEGDMDDMSGSEPDMGGGMSEEDMTKLEEAEGAAFDEMFLTMMIEHHKGAVEMAETEIDKGQNPDALALAQEIVQAQEAEITEMEGLLETAG